MLSSECYLRQLIFIELHKVQHMIDKRQNLFRNDFIEDRVGSEGKFILYYVNRDLLFKELPNPI